jgi:glucose-1-phosphate thymidylyltransferase
VSRGEIVHKVVGLIPAAGRGTRLAPFPCAKELFPVGYQDYQVKGKVERRPKVVSQYLFEELVEAGAGKIFIILGEGKHDIMNYYGDGRRFGAHVSYLYQEELRGMPFALDLAYPWLSGGETVVFGMPDTIVEPKDAFIRLLDHHKAQDADLTLGLFATDTPWKFGMVGFDSQGRVTDNIDKPQETDLRYMWGICCWGPRFTELMHRFLLEISSGNREIVLSEVFDEALRQGLDVRALCFDEGQYMDIGTAEELDTALHKFHL